MRWKIRADGINARGMKRKLFWGSRKVELHLKTIKICTQSNENFFNHFKAFKIEQQVIELVIDFTT